MVAFQYLSTLYTGDKAIKGEDYIHLLDENGIMLAAFDGVTDFSGFSLLTGSWSSPSSTTACSIAVVREDGTVCAGGYPLWQFYKTSTPMLLVSGTHYGTELPSSGVPGQLFFKLL